MSKNTKAPQQKFPVRNNPFRETFFQRRKQLITEVEQLRAYQESLRGVKGTTQQWDETVAKIAEIQVELEKLTKLLGLEKVDHKLRTFGRTGNGVDEYMYGGLQRGEVVVMGAETPADASRIKNGEDYHAHRAEVVTVDSLGTTTRPATPEEISNYGERVKVLEEILSPNEPGTGTVKGEWKYPVAKGE